MIGAICMTVNLPIPDHGGFSLVGDPDRSHLAALTALHDLHETELHVSPDLLRVVLHEARVWIDLLVLQLMHGHHLGAAAGKQDASRGGGALVDGDHKAVAAAHSQIQDSTYLKATKHQSKKASRKEMDIDETG